MNRYLPILTLEAKHHYYENGYLKGAVILPNPMTNQWLRANGLLLRAEKGNQITLYAPETNNLSSLVSNTPKFAVLPFTCRVDDPYLYNYTIGMADFTKNTLKFTYEPIDEDLDFNEVELIPQVEPGESEPAYFLLEIPVYVLSVEQPKTLIAQFTTRTFTWRYYVISGGSVDLQTISLGGQDAQLFSGPKETTLPNDQKAVLFDSGSNLIPIKERSEIDLNLSVGNPGRVLIPRMPVPSVQGIRTEKDSAGEVQWVADIYVYL